MAHLDIGSGSLVANTLLKMSAFAFYRNTYLHLGGAILAFILVEALMIQNWYCPSIYRHCIEY